MFRQTSAPKKFFGCVNTMDNFYIPTDEELAEEPKMKKRKENDLAEPENSIENVNKRKRVDDDLPEKKNKQEQIDDNDDFDEKKEQIGLDVTF